MSYKLYDLDWNTLGSLGVEENEIKGSVLIEARFIVGSVHKKDEFEDFSLWVGTPQSISQYFDLGYVPKNFILLNEMLPEKVEDYLNSIIKRCEGLPWEKARLLLMTYFESAFQNETIQSLRIKYD